MKICKTCRYWSWKFKGYCYRQNRGVGQFYSCEEWVEDPPLSEASQDDKDHSYCLSGITSQGKVAKHG